MVTTQIEDTWMIEISDTNYIDRPPLTKIISWNLSLNPEVCFHETAIAAHKGPFVVFLVRE